MAIDRNLNSIIFLKNLRDLYGQLWEMPIASGDLIQLGKIDKLKRKIANFYMTTIVGIKNLDPPAWDDHTKIMQDVIDKLKLEVEVLKSECEKKNNVE